MQDTHRRALTVFVFFIASELANMKASCTGCLEDWPSQTDHFCLNYGDGFEDDTHETEVKIRDVAWQLERCWEREDLIQRWKEFAKLRDVFPSSTPAYFDTDFMTILFENILYIFVKEPHLVHPLYESGNFLHIPEMKNLVRDAVRGTVFDRMAI